MLRVTDHRELGNDLAMRAASEASPQVSRFVGTIFGSAVIQLDAMIEDRWKTWRLRQWLKLATKSEALLERNGLTASQIPFDVVLPLIESASLVEDENLVDCWAALLANAAGQERKVPPSFVHVMKELEPATVGILSSLYEDHFALAPELRGEYFIFFHDGEKARIGDFEYHVDNLVRLGLVRSHAGTAQDFYEFLTLTNFGAMFIEACQPPGTERPAPRLFTKEDVLREMAGGSGGAAWQGQM